MRRNFKRRMRPIVKKFALIELFKFFINSKSETPNDGGLLDFIEEYLDGFNAVRVDVEDVKNLFIYKKFSEGEHLCFAGHVDVVPAGDGWSSDPYKLTEKDGYLYGDSYGFYPNGRPSFHKEYRDRRLYDIKEWDPFGYLTLERTIKDGMPIEERL